MAFYNTLTNSLGESKQFGVDAQGRNESSAQYDSWVKQGLGVSDNGTGTIPQNAQYHLNTANANVPAGSAGIGTDFYTAYLNS